MVSVIIINYNVKYFLEQCLYAVRAALLLEPGEVIVFDNASTDGSREYLEPRFPDVQFIWNAENLGFGRANNRACALAKGELILYLNPDTIIGEDSLRLTAYFLREHADAGALGVRMIDGSGNFLKESKRAYPGIATSFFKLCGLSSLFPTSPVFARYHLGHLDAHQTHEVDVLAGAFMMVKKQVLEKTGGFDEQFFMYGEDIDLSYRIQLAGYKNYFFADTTIIHFKGESTKRGSLNYVRIFYKAMIIFVEKHYSGFRASLFRLFLNIAIWARAVLALLAGFAMNNGIALLDGISVLLSYSISAMLWSILVRPETTYDPQLLGAAFTVAAFFYLAIGRLSGLHDRRQKQRRELKVVTYASLLVFFVYALLPESYRFSRGILVLGSLISYLAISFSRQTLRRNGLIEEVEKQVIAVVGEESDVSTVSAVLLPDHQRLAEDLFIRISPEKISRVQQGGDLTAFMFGILNSDLILCKGKLSYREIIGLVERLPKHLRVRFHTPGSDSIVGSDSSQKSGIAFSSERMYTLGTQESVRLKRSMDLAAALLFLISFPLTTFLVDNSANFCRNIVDILRGRKTWIGYIQDDLVLPRLLPSVLGTDGLPRTEDPKRLERLLETDRIYAREYSATNDIRLLLKGLRYLGTR